jgi:putative transposase
VDAINVKVRDGQVANRPVYAAIGVDLECHKDILGMWFGDGGGESAKFWMVVLTELRNRGVADVFFLVCDGGPARQCQRGMACHDRANLSDSFDP